MSVERITSRTRLKKLAGEKAVFTATVQCRGKDKSRQTNRRHVCLVAVCDEDGELVADHVWVRDKRFKGIMPGQQVTFIARPYRYRSQGKNLATLADIRNVSVVKAKSLLEVLDAAEGSTDHLMILVDAYADQIAKRINAIEAGCLAAA